ncbi:MAG: hypothetical protein XE00_0412 [Desulfofundulus kuznetsovii]|nr:MAG: hypothetical protein XD84_0843 [Desulfotomaculum sp. 46_80]KUK85061.1 MAG: hypothetical protein XE00_0412 [Desulfofundulus kuznetsovii]
MSVPGRIRTWISALEAVFVYLGSTTMTFAPFDFAMPIQRIDWGWFSATLAPMIKKASAFL